VHTVLHETYEIIHETLCDLHSASPPPRAVCREANRFAAAALLQPTEFSLFAQVSGFDVVALQKQYQCSYAAVALRLAEVMLRQPMMAILYERKEKGVPQRWKMDATPDAFRARVVARTPGFGARRSTLLCGERGRIPWRGTSPSPGSLAHHVFLTGRATYAEEEPGRNGSAPGDLAVAARPVIWYGRLAKIALIAVPHRDRAVIRPQLAQESFDRLEEWAAASW